MCCQSLPNVRPRTRATGLQCIAVVPERSGVTSFALMSMDALTVTIFVMFEIDRVSSDYDFVIAAKTSLRMNNQAAPSRFPVSRLCKHLSCYRQDFPITPKRHRYRRSRKFVFIDSLLIQSHSLPRRCNMLPNYRYVPTCVLMNTAFGSVSPRRVVCAWIWYIHHSS